MAKHAKADTLDPADRLHPRSPKDDDLDAASAILDDVLNQIAALQDELRIVAHRHVDAAPSSSVHVLDLTSAVARMVLDWIARWPA